MDKNIFFTFIKPLLYTFAFFASVHVGVLLVIVLMTGSVKFLNVFYIVGLTYFLPDIDKGIVSQIISLLIIIFVYCFFFLKNKK